MRLASAKWESTWMNKSSVSLDQFVDAVSEHYKQAVTADTWLWRDLKLFGDDYAFEFVGLARRLGGSVREGEHVHLGDYLPGEYEVGLFGRLATSRTIPDIKVREFYAFLEFANNAVDSSNRSLD